MATLHSGPPRLRPVDTDDNRELPALSEHNGQLRLLTETRPEHNALSEVATGKPQPSRAVDTLATTLIMSEPLACNPFALKRSTYRQRLPGQAPADMKRTSEA